MTQKRIRSAFESRLATWAAARSPALTVAYQNVSFPPPAGAHLRAFVLPADTLSSDLEGVHRGYIGLFQVSIVVPDGAGPGAAEGIQAELEALFPVNLKMTVSGIDVFVMTALSAKPAQPEDIYYVIPMSCRYRADVI